VKTIPETLLSTDTISVRHEPEDAGKACPKEGFYVHEDSVLSWTRKQRNESWFMFILTWAVALGFYLLLVGIPPMERRER
jgi:hypothetical protein